MRLALGLAAVLLTVGCGPRDGGIPLVRTSDRLAALASAAEAKLAAGETVADGWRMAHGRAGESGGASNRLNEGSEALVRFLRQGSLAAIPGFEDRWLSNTDEDVMEGPAGVGRTVDLFEACDAWKNPIACFDGGLLGLLGPSQRYRMGDGREVDVSLPDGLSGSLGSGAKKLVLLAAGPDQRFGTEDDLVEVR